MRILKHPHGYLNAGLHINDYLFLCCEEKFIKFHEKTFEIDKVMNCSSMCTALK